MPEALQDIDNIENYIAQDNPKASIDMTKRIITSIEAQLNQFQNIGRAGRFLGTRELFIPKTPYFVVYRVKNGLIEIVRILHSSQKWPG